MNTLTCDILLQYLSDYIDNELSDPLTEIAKAHLKTCQNCRVVLDTTQQTRVLAHTYGTRTIPAARKQKLFNELKAAFLAKEGNDAEIAHE